MQIYETVCEIIFFSDNDCCVCKVFFVYCSNCLFEEHNGNSIKHNISQPIYTSETSGVLTLLLYRLGTSYKGGTVR